MDEKELKERSKQFTLRVMKLVDAVPNTISGRAIANQLVRSDTSVGANYRPACRGRSKVEFIAKLDVVIEEADECEYWLELIIDSDLLPKNNIQPLAHELAAMFVASIRTAKSTITNQNQKWNNPV